MPTPINVESAPARTLATIAKQYSLRPANQSTAAALHAEAISIWEECRARGETLPQGNDLQCLLLIHRFASQLAAYNINIPDFLYLSVAEYEDAIQQATLFKDGG
ncbi:hypothetical protein [Pantoea phage Nafs113]|nr:hypothetical protein [Pantoea phage Nafs113]